MRYIGLYLTKPDFPYTLKRNMKSKTLAAITKWTCQHVRLARCPQE